MTDKEELISSESDALLERAMKKEILFQADQNNIELTEEEASTIADTMVFERDWSAMNDWILEEIENFQEEQ